MHEPLPSGTLGKYRLLSKVGAGGMGEVWCALDTGSVQRTVAIKLIATSGLAGEWLTHTLIDEARAMVSLPLHPNLVALHDVLEQNGMVALVMEFVEGQGLRTRMARHPRGLPWQDIYPIAKGLMDGLMHAHQHGLIHRDLKPENLKLRPATLETPLVPEDLKILDFGLARHDPGHVSTSGESMGTPGYMSPEQFLGDIQSPACDQYALGLILFELISGRRALLASNHSFEAWREAHLHVPISNLRALREDVPASVEALIAKALAKSPGDRHASVASFAEGLLPELAFLAQWQDDLWDEGGADVGVPNLSGLDSDREPTLPGSTQSNQTQQPTRRVMEPAIEGDAFEVMQEGGPTRFTRIELSAGLEPRSMRALGLLEKISAELMGAGSVSELLRAALEGLCAHLKAAGGLMLLKDAEGHLAPLAAWGTSVQGEVRFSRSLLHTVLQERQALVLGGADFQGPLGEAASIRARAISTALVAPLQHQGQIVGLLYLDGGPGTAPFSQEDLQLAVALAHLGAARIQRDRLEAEAKAKEKLEREMLAARQIQTALLPESLPMAPGWEAHGSNESCLRVSGDGYGGWLSASGRIRYAIADVSGKGVGPGLLMAAFLSWMEAHADSELGTAELAGLISTGLGRRTSAKHYLTAVLVDLEPASGHLTLTNAGHVSPVIIRADGTVEEIPSHGMPLAMLGGSNYGAFETRFQAGDLLLLVTDGLTEATNATDEEFGLNRLAELVRGGSRLGLPHLDGMLRAEVTRFMQGQARVDDQTALLIRLNG